MDICVYHGNMQLDCKSSPTEVDQEVDTYNLPPHLVIFVPFSAIPMAHIP